MAAASSIRTDSIPPAVSFSTPSRNTTRPSLIHHHDVVMVSGLGRFGNTSPRCHPCFDRCFAVPVDPRGALIASLDTLADVVSRAVSEYLESNGIRVTSALNAVAGSGN